MNIKIITLTITSILLATAFTTIANDKFIFDDFYADNPSIIKISEGVYAISYSGPDNSGIIKTICIEKNGQIIKPEIDKLEFELNTCSNPKIIHILNNVYSVTYSGPDGRGYIKTIRIEKNGNINNRIVDEHSFANSDVNQPDIIHFYDSYYGIAYGDIGTLKVFNIDDQGKIDLMSQYVSGIQFSVSNGLSPDIFPIRDNIFGVAFTGDNDKGFIVTFVIDIRGSSVNYRGIDYFEFDSIRALNPNVLQINSNLYSISYTSTRDIGKIMTLRIDNNGFISTIDSFIFDRQYGLCPDSIKIGNEVIALSYTGVNNLGYISILEINQHGFISSNLEENFIFDEDKGISTDIIYMIGDYYAIAYSGSINRGILKTIGIDSSGQIILERVSYDVDGDFSEEYAINNDWDISNGYEIYLDTDSSSDVVLQFDGDFDNKFDYFIKTGGPQDEYLPDIYWDPDSGVLDNNVRIADIDYDGIEEWIFDSNGDDREDKYYDLEDRQVYNFRSYSLKINVIGEGLVSIDPNGFEFLSGTNVNLNAIATFGWTFDHWSGDLEGDENPKSIVMNENKIINAHFVKDVVYHELLISINGEGFTDPEAGKHVYEHGAQETITADVLDGSCYMFSHWSGDVVSSENPITIDIDDDIDLIANFELGSYSLDLNVFGNGQTSPSSGVHSFDCGSNVDIEAIADPGWVFSHWSGSISGSENQTSFDIHYDMTINAHFERIEYSLSVSSIGSGSGIIDVFPIGPYYYLDEVTIWANASSGSSFISWSGDVSGSNNPEMLIIDSNKTIIANFTSDPVFYNLFIDIEGNGTTNPAPNIIHSYPEGAIIDIEAIAYEDWSFNHWSGDASGSNNQTTITMDSNKTVTAHFSEIFTNYTIEIIILGNGTTNPEPGNHSYVEGTNLPILAIPDPNCDFYGWFGHINSTNASESITINQNMTIIAYFVNHTQNFSININVEGNGSVVIIPDLPMFPSNTIVALIANASEGWMFDHWSGDDTNNSVYPLLVILMDSNKSITAHFTSINETEDNDTEPPTNITGFNITDEHDGNLSLSWNESTDNNGISHYEIWRNDSLYQNTTNNSYLDTGLIIGVNYSYKIRAVDTSGNFGEFSETIVISSNESDNSGNNEKDDEDEEDNGGGNPSGGSTNNGGGGGSPPSKNTQNQEEEKIKPVADASATEQRYAYVNEDIILNGSKSSDEDGYIASYQWNFDDGNIVSGMIIEHNFSEPGEYNVSLVVTDNDSLSNSTSILIYIIKANIPPEIPDIKGPTEGEINKNITFEFISIDEDNKNLSYIIDWDDGSNNSESGFIPSGESYIVNHSWNKSGNYSISVKVIDEDDASTETSFDISIKSNETDDETQDLKGLNLGVMFGILGFILLLLLIILLIFILSRRKKDNEEKEKKEKSKKKSKSKKQKDKKGNKKKNTDKKKDKKKSKKPKKKPQPLRYL